MTNRDFYNAVINGTIGDDEVNFAKAAIEKLDARNENRKSKPSKTALANEPIKASLLTYITEQPQTAAELAAKVDISTAKASALLLQLVNEKAVAKTEVKIVGKGKVNGYCLPTEE